MSTQTEHSRATLNITHLPPRSRGSSPRSNFQVVCQCGDKSQVTQQAGLCWQWHDMHRDQFEVGTSEPVPRVTN